ncbi:carbohydrate-binding domain-containing protein [Candidatus Saccharibacteria bacterium]|nr:carbohydrate-binding domain-containing protein [Candidatus Saccharibacteria bacterium]
MNKNVWQWVAGGAALVAMVGVAVGLNLYYHHNGDNAANIAGSIDIDNGDTKINWNRYNTTEVNLDEVSGVYNITESGTYILTGSLDGVVTVNADKNEGVVRLILNNATIKNASGPAIACYSADDLVIELEGENVVADGATYDAKYDEDVTGAIYSKSDLSFTGDGSLYVTANYQDGIVGKDDLKFNSGTYKITAKDDAVRGKDSVYVVDGDFTISAGSDGFKSTNETDTGKGFILIENGKFALTTGAKGIKAINSILIYSGDFTINSTDDAVHSNNYIGITGGTFAITSGDDGMHADARLIVDGGKITITKSYEGLEAQKISINGGEISIVANDDGINAGGGADASATNRVGAGTFDADENCELVINGGTLYVNAAGDGLDSNGYLYINGGEVVVDGPTNNGNGALDAGAGIVMNGGTAIAVGASGMAETLGSSSSIYNISVYFTSTLSKGTSIEIKDTSGNTVISHVAAKTFNHLAAGTNKFVKDGTYTIYVNGEKYQEFTISDVTTVVGNATNNFQNMNMMPGGQAGQTGQTGQNGQNGQTGQAGGGQTGRR